MVLPPRHGLSLCAGGGGLDMGLGLAEPGFATSCYVEIEEYPRSTLIAGQRAGYLHPAPIWDDLKRFNARPWRGQIDTLLAGYPCQPFSQAGQRKGEDDPRHLFPDIERIIDELGDGLEWCLFENVAGHLTLGLEVVVRSLQGMGFRVAVGLFSAEETGATHERQRVFIVAHRKRGSGERERTDFGESDNWSNRRHDVVGGRRDKLQLADPDGRDTGAERQQRSGEQRLHAPGRGAGAGDVGNAAGIGRGEGWPEHEFWSGRDTAASASGKLADRHDPRSQRQHADILDPEGREIEARHARLRGGAGLHPPGPSDMDAWRDVLVVHPDGAPALSLRDLSTFARYFAALIEAGQLSEEEAERRLRRMADGLASRSRTLRLLGNGVHPLAAAHAWRALSYAHGLGRVDLATACGGGDTEADEPVLMETLT